MKHDIEGVGERIICKRVDVDETVKDGIVIPDSAQGKTQIARIVAVGEGWRDYATGKLIPLSLKTGDKILLPMFGVTDIKIDEVEYVICKEDDVLAKLKEK
ncbi:co-chaperone GroES [bacterium]|nr:MAG: co-chaperone GroES [bacterium]